MRIPLLGFFQREKIRVEQSDINMDIIHLTVLGLGVRNDSPSDRSSFEVFKTDDTTYVKGGCSVSLTHTNVNLSLNLDLFFFLPSKKLEKRGSWSSWCSLYL